MTSFQTQYQTFIESICDQFGMPEASPALQNGFHAYCEAVDEGMVKLVDYLNQMATEQIRDKEGNPVTTHKAFNYFENAEVKEGMWGVHFTNLEAYQKIMIRGFSRGTANLDRLAYTGHATGKRRKDGWLFALPIDSDYLKEYDLGYGDCCFLIKTDCVLVKHLVDDDTEMLFRGKDVSTMIPFQYDEEFDYWVCDTDGNKFDTLTDVIAHYTAGN